MYISTIVNNLDGGTMGEMMRLLADLDSEKVKKFKKALIDDEISFKQWLIRQIDNDLKQRRKGGKKK